ncbi:ABC transporter ATP-binding protein [Paenisporosarcina sp. TG-14]|uniref:ABC transporter ATP-binding protein n=1 Tax=Paenisporosarcina sp. TG-14 TaxID=1231057 RepID=UPI0002EDF17E|nr:ABC transporter ATP-binding protein [Paenisporosarcina sp. TG-14]
MLNIKNLSIGYETERGVAKAVNNIDLTVEKGKILGLVGESGCGKSTVLYSLMGLISSPGKILDGSVSFEGKELTKFSKEDWRNVRGKEIAMIFQDPMTTLNPAYKIGDQIKESFLIHQDKKPLSYKRFFKRSDEDKVARERVLELMDEVGIPAPDSRFSEYPHQFSGGMQQRAIIAIALSCNPKLLLADEPTTALDVTVQAQILELMKTINKTHGTSIIVVTHDLAVASEFCDEIAVMYAGQIVERGHVDDIVENPKHPYTQGLINSIPKIENREKIKPIPGNVVDILELGEGCAFASRCAFAKEECNQNQQMLSLENGRQVRCILYKEEALLIQ